MLTKKIMLKHVVEEEIKEEKVGQIWEVEN